MKYIVLFFLGLSQMVLVNAQQQKNAMDLFINNLMSKMTVEEKIGQLNLLTPGGGVATGAVVSKGVEEKIAQGKVGGLFGVIGYQKIKQAQELAITKSRLRIPLLFGSDVIHGYKTTFPIPLALACSWDIEMIKQSAALAATEATADGLTWAFSPMVDITRDPRWGRIAEGSGEDPYLGGAIAKAMVQGYQGDDLRKDNTLLACVKHFALYGAPDGGRDYNTVDMSKLRMYNEYLQPYKAAVEAGVASVMTSFNTIDNVPATGNKWLLTDLLRKQWGFNGFVVSDYTALNEMIEHGMGSLQEVAALAINAGLDMDMVGEGFLLTVQKSLKEGKVSIATINNACRRILEAKYKLGLFDNPFKYCNAARAEKEILSAQQKKAALQFAERSMVLLKNQASILPLKQTGRIAVVGPLANDKANMLGTWAVSGNRSAGVPVLEGIKNLVGEKVELLYAKGANIDDDSAFAKKVNVFGTRIDIDKKSPQQLLQEAIEVANKTDVIIAVVGEASEMSGESASRSNIHLPASQQKLLTALQQTGKPLILVVMAGRPLILNWESNNANAILYAWHPGQEAGHAVANVLFGVYNPSGKLVNSFPRAEGQIPVFYNHLNTGRPNGGDVFQKFKTNYLDVPNSPLYPFGYGLSYTNFTYSEVVLNKKVLNAKQNITATIRVTNTGNYDGEEVVQLYIQDEVASIARPVKELKAFEKLLIKKGESKEVSFEIDVNSLKFYNSNLQYVAEPGTFKVFIGSNSRDVKEATFTLQ